MNGFSFGPRLESLNDRLCMSATGGAVMAVDMFKSGDEAGLIGLLRQDEEKGAGVDNKGTEAEGIVVEYRTGDEAGLIGLLRQSEEKGAGVDTKGEEASGVILEYRTGEMGWDVKPGEERGAAVDFGLLLPAVKVGDVKPGEKEGAAVDYRVGEMGWDVKPGEAQGAAVDYMPTDQLGGPFVGGTAKP